MRCAISACVGVAATGLMLFGCAGPNAGRDGVTQRPSPHGGRLVLKIERLSPERVRLAAVNMGREPLVIDRNLVIGFEIELRTTDGTVVGCAAPWDDAAAPSDEKPRPAPTADEIAKRRARFEPLPPGEAAVRVVDLTAFKHFLVYHSSTMNAEGVILHGPDLADEVPCKLPADVSPAALGEVIVRYVGCTNLRDGFHAYVGAYPEALGVYAGTAEMQQTLQE